MALSQDAARNLAAGAQNLPTDNRHLYLVPLCILLRSSGTCLA